VSNMLRTLTACLCFALACAASSAQEADLPAAVTGETEAAATLLDGENQPTRSASEKLGEPFVDVAAFRARFDESAKTGHAGVVTFEKVTPATFSKLAVQLPGQGAAKVLIDVDAPPPNPDKEAGATADRVARPTSGRLTFSKRISPDHLWKFESQKPVGFALVLLAHEKDPRFPIGERQFQIVVTYDDGSTVTPPPLAQAYGKMGEDDIFIGLLAPPGRTIAQVTMRISKGNSGAYFYIDDLALILGS